MSFEPINTQEEFDARIKERLDRQEKSIREGYAGFLSPEETAKKYEGYVSAEDVEKKVKETEDKFKDYLSPADAKVKDDKIAKYEADSVKTRVAKDAGVPLDLIDSISGANEDEMKASAEKLAKYVRTDGAPPSYSNEPSAADAQAAQDAALREVIRKL